MLPVRHARRLAAREYVVFPFDFRGHGFSEGSRDHAKAAADTIAAVRAVRALGARSSSEERRLAGSPRSSRRRSSARPVQGVLSISGPAAIEGQLDARAAAPLLRVPTLYVAAEQDRNPPYDFAAEARELHDLTGTSEKRVELVPGSLHGTFLVDSSPRVRAALERFLRNPVAAVP